MSKKITLFNKNFIYILRKNSNLKLAFGTLAFWTLAFGTLDFGTLVFGTLAFGTLAPETHWEICQKHCLQKQWVQQLICQRI